MNVGMVSNTFDYDDDVLSGKKTFPVRFGQATTVKFLTAVSVLAYITILAGIIAGAISYWTLVMAITFPLGIQVVSAVKKYTDTSFYTPAMFKAIALSSVAGLLLICAYITDSMI